MTDHSPIESFKPIVQQQVSDVAPPTSAGAVDALAESTVEGAGLELKARSQWSYARSRFLRHRLAMAGLLGLLFFLVVGAFANVIAPYPIDQINLEEVMIGPTLSGHHFFGTDEVGRDFLSRIVFGIRTSEEVGMFVALVPLFWLGHYLITFDFDPFPAWEIALAMVAQHVDRFVLRLGAHPPPAIEPFLNMHDPAPQPGRVAPVNAPAAAS